MLKDAVVHQKKERVIDSPIKRYFFTLCSNLTIFVASFVTAGIVPRALGPKQYGDYGFLSRIATSFRRVLDMDTSTAFFTLSSKHEESGPLVKAYSVWFLGQLFLIITLIICAFVLGLGGLIWPGQQFRYVFWVAIFDWVFFLGATLKALADAKGFTVKAQLVNLAISILNILILVFFALRGWLDLGVYIAIQILVSSLLSLFLISRIIFAHLDLYWLGAVKGHLRGLIKYFYRYCSPLVVYGLVSFIFEYFDRMILQAFSGSVEQGYFQIATTWAAPVALFTTSILSIYKREVAHSLGREDKDAAAEIFSKYLKMMYFLALVFGVFLAFHARSLLELIAGPKFILATPALIIMAFYPAHQAYGQLGGAAFLASERTSLLRNLGIIGVFISIPITYFLIAPQGAFIPGLGLGSKGLALKSVIYNILIVQVYLWYNCKYFKLDVRPFWWHQVYSFILLVGTMFVLKTAIGLLLGDLVILKLVLDALVYFTVVGCGIYFYPGIASLEKEEISKVIEKIRKNILLKI